MLRPALLVCFVAAAAAVPALQSDTEFCNGQTECPPDCTYVSRNEKCVFCQCAGSPLAIKPIPLPTPEPEPQCEYGPAFIDECNNDCKCVKGGRYGCTRKLCKPGQRPERPKTCSGSENLPERAGQRVVCEEGIVKVKALESECKYGPHYIDECDNDCKCDPSGKYDCDTKPCLFGRTAGKPKACSSAANLPKRDCRVFCHEGIVKVQDPNDKCLPGAVFMDEEDCNTCSCSETGFALCTLKFCLPEPETVSAPGCPYGPGFIDQCNNDCNCVDGRFYGCTFKACKPGEIPQVPMLCTSSDNLPKRDGQHVFCDEGAVKLQTREAGCEHGPGFIDQCNNDCHCMDGGSYGCTRKACKPGEQPEVPMTCSGSDSLPSRSGVRVFCSEGIVKLQKPVCPFGEEYIDECGADCRCLEEGYACTETGPCMGKTAGKPMTCEASDKLPVRQNRRVFCHENVVKVQHENATCIPGSSWNLDCNGCFCTDSGISGCTLKACIGEPSASTVTCDEGLPECPQDCGQRYNPGRDCYECPCSVGAPGDVAVRFEQDCPPGTVVSDSGAFFKTCGPSDKCPHGLEFIDQCGNDCRCQAGGYSCSKKACQPGQTAEEPMTCKGAAQLPKRDRGRVFCHQGIVKVQDGEARCIPDSVFKEDCNSCFCNENGNKGCTFKLCRSDKPEECEHGPNFIDECNNDCMCINNESYACSRKACKPGEKTMKPMQCSGARLLPDRPKGVRVLCHDGIVKTQPEAQECLPGSTYKNKCNTCTCGGECTFKFCPEE